LLSVLVLFFQYGRWGAPAETEVDGQSLTAEDQLLILIQAAAYLTTLNQGSPEAHICYERALKGVFLTAVGADATQIEASFRAAIKTAREQKSVSLEKRAEGTYAEYRRQKASAAGGRGFRLPVC
jgi:hypothetical protein